MNIRDILLHCIEGIVICVDAQANQDYNCPISFVTITSLLRFTCSLQGYSCPISFVTIFFYYALPAIVEVKPCRLLVTFANSLYKTSGRIWIYILFDTVMVFLQDFFKVDFEKKIADAKNMKNFPRGKDLRK